MSSGSYEVVMWCGGWWVGDMCGYVGVIARGLCGIMACGWVDVIEW